MFRCICDVSSSIQTAILSIWQVLAAAYAMKKTILKFQLMQVIKRKFNDFKVVLQNHATLTTGFSHKALHQQDRVTILNAINTPDYDIS